MLKDIKKTVTDIIVYTLGCLIYSAAVTMFISANEFSPGGFTGIATALQYLLKIPSGLSVFLLNIPVLILGFVKFGGRFIGKTAVATVILSLSLTLTDLLLPKILLDRILAAVFGGILMGLGLGMVLHRGATTGGVDIIAKLINKKLRHFTVGKIILIIDALIIAFAAFVYKNIESALYSVISMYASSQVMDIMLYGSDTGKIIYIVTEFHNEICLDINKYLKRGVTILSAKGGYTGKEKNVLYCTVRRHEVNSVYRIVEKYDKNAFIVVSDAGEIIGEGFKALS